MARQSMYLVLQFSLAAFSFFHARGAAAAAASGFISIDCGGPREYVDTETGATYVPDSSFIDSGVDREISVDFVTSDLQPRFRNLRSFPDGVRNCYTLKLPNDVQYLMRAQFLYGDYDSRTQVTEFDLYIGVNLWSTIRFVTLSEVITEEMIHLPSRNVTNVCLVNKGLGIPFISVLEVRPIGNDTYVYGSPSGTLNLLQRINFGALLTDQTRFADDVYDRLWNPIDMTSTTNYLSTGETILMNSFAVPSKVMSTAVTPKDATGWLNYSWTANIRTELYIYMHFAELEDLGYNQTREFNIYVNGNFHYTQLAPENFSSTTIFQVTPIVGTWFSMSLRMTENSTLPPLINALEIYALNRVSQLETNPTDVQAILNIKSTYSVAKIWQGDPCVPIKYSWDGLTCSFNGSNPPRIINLNLSSNNLIGQISKYISGLEFLESLDLSNNSLTESIPDFLSTMKFLKFINLKGNNLTGKVPEALIKKSQEGTLILRLDPYLCSSASCITRKKQPLVPVVASASAILLIMILLIVMWWKWKKEDISLGEFTKLKMFKFTHMRVKRMTNDFMTVIGEGGFGKVYLGTLKSGQKVAVKTLSSASDQGLKEFQREIEALTKAYHVNVVSLVGFCDDLKHLALIYEYMPNGNLKDQLSGKHTTSVLSWELRVQIAVHAAEGLDYLHNSCDPPIIHCDLKTSNILLDANMQGKLADFGLSKAYRHFDATHVSTLNPAGTHGYMDMECALSGQFGKGSDMYSFGVILMELVTGRPALSEAGVPLLVWLPAEFEKIGTELVDTRLQGDFGSGSARQILKIAIACVQQPSYGRPQISEVLAELKQLLLAE